MVWKFSFPTIFFVFQQNAGCLVSDEIVTVGLDIVRIIDGCHVTSFIKWKRGRSTAAFPATAAGKQTIH